MIKRILARNAILQFLYIRCYLALRSYMEHREEYCDLQKQLANHASSKRIILIGIPHHRNLGDHAIAIAERLYLQDYFPDWQVIEIPDNMFSAQPGMFIKYFSRNDILVLTGGGFLGNLWFEYGERMLQILLLRCPNNKIVVFPQTYCMTPDKKGARQLQRFKKKYQEHDSLLMFLRDNSYDFVRKNLLGGKFTECYKVPDIVLYLNPEAHVRRGNDVLFCLRNDKESSITKEGQDSLRNIVAASGAAIRNGDTIVDSMFPISNRDAVFQQKLQEFFSVKLVVTDRLHGMLFSVITGTPCIALNNSTGKVFGVWDNWVQRIPYIKISSAEDFSETFRLLSRSSFSSIYSSNIFRGEWESMAQKIRSFCGINEQEDRDKK